MDTWLTVGAGTVVLNQDPTRPMSGTVVNPTDQSEKIAVEDGLLLVKWNNGIVELESPGDLTLTANLILVEQRR